MQPLDFRQRCQGNSLGKRQSFPNLALKTIGRQSVKNRNKNKTPQPLPTTSKVNLRWIIDQNENKMGIDPGSISWST